MSWPNLSDLVVAADAEAPVGLVGVPLGIGSVTPGRCDLAPQALRKVLRRIGRYDIDTRSELGTTIADHGDVALEGETIEEVSGAMVEAIATSVDAHALSLVVGGNNAVTRPAVHALGLPLEKVGLVTLDAHFDMRGTEDGLRNGNPVRALLEDGLPGANVAQVGLMPFANSKVMHEDALAAGNRVITLAETQEMGVLAAVSAALAHVSHCAAIVVDCDIDVIDRAQFPGAPGARPGGMPARDFFAAVRRLAAEPRVRIIDLVEWDPLLDASDLSSLVAGRWMAEALAGFEAR
ncbi:arginase family protein [Sphingomicrobium astaxanthinifaciens]|uniref:arginase family protein n=1 Tax=Sphingomicrobium astaxanthinifaciens TaxID=1227949 RepID=UPI001FCBCD6F|nr:arginase family protein [Sphingomicrobium astaxanthinifaciens]MCJ7421054.1 arginase family protein [Sphingomicrobium astaxanthinifaciens]